PSLGELLARGVAKLDHSPQLDDAGRVDLLAMFSRLYENLGEPAQSRRLADRAVALSARALAPTDIEAIRALTARGYAEVRTEDFAAGGADLRLARRRMRAQGIHGEDLIRLLGPLAAVENSEGHADAALQLSREALSERIATWGPDDARVGIGYNDVASALEGLARYDEAIPMWRKTLQFELAHFGPSSNESTLALAGLASSEYRAGDWAQAHRHFTQALALYTRHGGQPQLTQVYAAQKACVLEGLRADRAAAQARCRQAQAWSADGFGETSALHGDSLEATAFGLEEAGDLAGARELFAAARQRYGDSPANRMRVGRIDSELAGIDLLEGHPEQARTLLPAAIATWLPPLRATIRSCCGCIRCAPGSNCCAANRSWPGPSWPPRWPTPPANCPRPIHASLPRSCGWPLQRRARAIAPRHRPGHGRPARSSKRTGLPPIPGSPARRRCCVNPSPPASPCRTDGKPVTSSATRCPHGSRAWSGACRNCRRVGVLRSVHPRKGRACARATREVDHHVSSSRDPCGRAAAGCRGCTLAARVCRHGVDPGRPTGAGISRQRRHRRPVRLAADQHAQRPHRHRQPVLRQPRQQRALVRLLPSPGGGLDDLRRRGA